MVDYCVEQEKKMNHEEYLKRRDELLGIRMGSFSSFDKAILSLATGSLALSITFLDRIGKPFDNTTFAMIFLTWISFFLVILFNLASYLFALSNMNRKIAELDCRYKKELDTNKEDTKPEVVFWQNRAISVCNIGAFIAFFAGVLLFVVYIINIQAKNYQEVQSTARKENTMPDGKKNINEGKTESPKAVTQTTHKPLTQGDNIVTHGATEVPQAVLRPAKPSGGSSSESKKSE